MSDSSPSGDERRQRGLETYRRVYGEDAFVMDEGRADFFDLMLSHLFGEVWSRPGLSTPVRRLLVIGVLAAQHRFEPLGLQFDRALAEEELDVDQLREVVIQLVPYVGYPVASDLYRVSETSIARHRAARS